MKKRIMVDMDDVITTGGFLHLINEYLKTNYNGKLGKPRIEIIGTNETWYIIEQKEALADYFDDNPSKLYLFY